MKNDKNSTAVIEDKEIQITSIRFEHQGDHVLFQSHPLKLRYKGREYVLAEEAE